MLDTSKIKAITLDLDDTLWPIWPTIAHAETVLQQWLHPHAPLAAQVFADPVQRQALRDAAIESAPTRTHDLSAIRLSMIDLGLQRTGEDRALAAQAFEVFYAARMQVQLFADALPALRTLAQHYPLVAVSNGNADVHRIGIGAFFTASVSARDTGVAKPHPAIFHAAAQRLALHPEQVLHVGDDAHLDVRGALAVGMQTVWINRDGATWPGDLAPHATATDMAHLCQLLGLPRNV
jgi:putative hydrolase of the HAD superfamily